MKHFILIYEMKPEESEHDVAAMFMPDTTAEISSDVLGNDWEERVMYKFVEIEEGL